MNISESAEAFATARTTAPDPAFRLPLVSVIVVNYNYGRFLEQAVDSVFHQTYPNIECIIVDNASTDETPNIIAALVDRYPRIRVIRRANNDGQTAATLDGLAASSGSYVVFVDADDVLLAHAIETHAFVHLSMRIHVGFTSGDMLQVLDDELVLGTGEELNRYVRSGKGMRQNLLRPYRDRSDPTWPSAALAKSVSDKIHFVPPLATKWVWSPSSGICYRREALRLFADNPVLPELRTCTDMYFALAISALCGSVLIDEPLFMYRLHGTNVFSRRPQLNHFLGFELHGTGNSNDRAKHLLVDHLVEKAGRFCQNGLLKLNYMAMLVRLDCRDSDKKQPRWRRRSRAAGRLVDFYPDVVAALGPTLTKLLMFWFRVPISVIASLGRTPS